MSKKKSRRAKQRTLLIVLVILLSSILLAMIGWLWYQENVDRSGWITENDKTYYLDFHGDPVSGWQKIEDITYHFGTDGAMSTGWQEFDGKRYYFGEDGVMATDWQDIGGSRYCFASDGSMQTGWQDLDGRRYYLDEQGILATGWLDVDGLHRYFNQDGSLHSGWLDTEGSRVYLNEEGCIQTGWLDTGDSRYYLDENGTPVTGIVNLDGQDYRFREDGSLLTGWTEIDGIRCYFSSEGLLLTGWQDIDGSRYYLNEDGSIYTGWLKQGEYDYYLHADGKAAVGPTEIDGKTLYFTPKGIHVVLVNPWNPVPEDWEVDHVDIDWGLTVDRRCYDAMVAMLDACEEAGCYPEIAAAFRSLEKQQNIWNMYYNRYRNQGNSKDDALKLTQSRVATPGTSEHHLGLALDITGKEYYYAGYAGSSDKVQEWLAEHCWEYGFILRYTKEKEAITGIMEEDWHFRYVGTEVSLDMKDSGLCLEEYLGAVTETVPETTEATDAG